ncbi:hypothetical protein FACS1894186_3170 [Alphaproteobacteria bacterium]|nr:hypothetical protein FACS1894186_3170 [Alphaproteobacteria bacterium]
MLLSMDAGAPLAARVGFGAARGLPPPAVRALGREWSHCFVSLRYAPPFGWAHVEATLARTHVVLSPLPLPWAAAERWALLDAEDLGRLAASADARPRWRLAPYTCVEEAARLLGLARPPLTPRGLWKRLIALGAATYPQEIRDKG